MIVLDDKKKDVFIYFIDDFYNINTLIDFSGP